MNALLTLLLALGGAALGQVDLARTAANDAAAAAHLVTAPEERVELRFRSAAALAPTDLVGASVLLVDATQIDAPPTAPIRAAANAALAALGAEPIAPACSEEGWMDAARRTALERLFIADPAGALDSRAALRIAENEFIELLLAAANAPESAAPRDGEINYLDRPTLARLAVTELEKGRAPDPELLERAVRAVMALDPETARAYLVQAGPVRPVAAELSVLAAAASEEALQAAASILDPARRADVLLRRAASEPGAEGRTALVRAASDLAGVMADPAAKALILARAAALLAPAPESEVLAEQARQAALLVTGASPRALALATVAGCLGGGCRDKAEECLADAVALAETLEKGGSRAHAMMELAIACAPGLPDKAFEITDGLGKDRLASRIEVLLAVAASADEAGRAEATRRVLAAVGSAGTAADQLRVLKRLTLDALPPTEPPAPTAPQEEALPAAVAPAEIETPPAAPWPSPPPPRGMRGGAPIPEGGSAPPPEPEEPATDEPTQPEEPAEPADASPNDLAAAQLEAWVVIGDLLLRRATDRPNRTEKALAYIEAADWLQERDAVRAAEALALAAAELDGAPDSLGRLDMLLARAERLGPECSAAIARSLGDPTRRARALASCGLVVEALAGVGAMEDPWARASLTIELAVANVTPAGAAAACASLEALPPSERRDDLLARAIEGFALAPVPEAGDAVTSLTGLASGEAALARARLAAARRAILEGDPETAKEKAAQALELIASAGRPQVCLARLAVVEHLLGEDGLSTARGLTDPALRCRTLLEIVALLLAEADGPADAAAPAVGPV